MIQLAVLAVLIGVVSRVVIGRSAARSRVDHFYWKLIAEAFHSQRSLPVRLPGKYLLEDDKQAYPPLFGMLLGKWHLDRWGIIVVLGLEIVQVLLLGVVMLAFGASYLVVLIGVAVYLMAPVLVTYNTQLNPRILGDLFLFAIFSAEIFAVFIVDTQMAEYFLWFGAAVISAFLIMTHKMTLQLYLVLLLPWSLALNTVMPLVVLLGGIAIYVILVGSHFALYQFKMHWDIVRFWNRHWQAIGAHQFHHSPVYGDPSGSCSNCYHQPGIRGILQYLRLVISYAPFNLVFPFASLLTDVWPPAWLLIWLGGAYLWALGTLLIPWLKCFGGGHLYVFNAVVPGALYILWLPETLATEICIASGVLLSAVSLYYAWKIIKCRDIAQDENFQQAVSRLASLPEGRIAVFPLQSAEAVAYKTHHAVLWGAHGCGFTLMEEFWPVITRPLSSFLRQYRIDWLLWDERFWPEGSVRLNAEGVILLNEQTFGQWRLATCSFGSAANVMNKE